MTSFKANHSGSLKIPTRTPKFRLVQPENRLRKRHSNFLNNYDFPNNRQSWTTIQYELPSQLDSRDWLFFDLNQSHRWWISVATPSAQWRVTQYPHPSQTQYPTSREIFREGKWNTLFEYLIRFWKIEDWPELEVLIGPFASCPWWISRFNASKKKLKWNRWHFKTRDFV